MNLIDWTQTIVIGIIIIVFLCMCINHFIQKQTKLNIKKKEMDIFLKTRIIFTIQKLRKGILIGIHPTMRCNLSCSYCIADIFLGERPVFKKELTANEWFKIIDNYSKKIKLIGISGGEPSMYKDIVPLVNGFIKRKIAVRIITNLMATNFMKIDASPYVRIFATYHHETDKKRFDINLQMYRKRFLVAVNEIEGMGKYIKESKIKEFTNKITDSCRAGLNTLFIPDGRVVESCNAQDLLADNYKQSSKK